MSMSSIYTYSMSSVPEPPITGDSGVDEVLAKVAALSDVPLVEHPDVLKEAHHALLGFLNHTTDAP